MDLIVRPDNDFKLSTDRKTCTHAKWEKGKKRWKAVPNAYGHDRESCIARTPFCEDCYAASSEIWPAVRTLLAHNWRLVQSYEGRPNALAERFTAMVGRSIDLQRKAGVLEPVFRWMWDGELAGPTMATAIRKTAIAHPDCAMWIYSRRPELLRWFVDPTTGEPPANLAVFLSTDRDNVDRMRKAAKRWPWVRLAYSGQDWDETRTLADQAGEKRGLKCPELTGRIPLTNDDGVGACADCRWCLPGGDMGKRGHVAFAIDRT